MGGANYVVSASELYKLAKQMLNDGMEYVSISLMEPDNTDPDDPDPGCVWFSATRKTDPNWTDYETLDVLTDITE